MMRISEGTLDCSDVTTIFRDLRHGRTQASGPTEHQVGGGQGPALTGFGRARRRVSNRSLSVIFEYQD